MSGVPQEEPGKEFRIPTYLGFHQATLPVPRGREDDGRCDLDYSVNPRARYSRPYQLTVETRIPSCVIQRVIDRQKLR